MFAGLVDFDYSGKIVPELAESFTASPDGLRYNFVLRPNVLFHDGSLLTVADVKRSFERALHPKTPNPASKSLSFDCRIQGILRGDRHVPTRRTARVGSGSGDQTRCGRRHIHAGNGPRYHSPGLPLRGFALRSWASMRHRLIQDAPWRMESRNQHCHAPRWILSAGSSVPGRCCHVVLMFYLKDAAVQIRARRTRYFP